MISDKGGVHKKWVRILILLTLSLIMAVVVACDLMLVPTQPPPTATVAAPVPTATLVVDTTPTATPEPLNEVIVVPAEAVLVVDTTPTATPEPLHVESQIYNDNVFILPVAEDLLADPIFPQRESAIRFYEYFEDRFDFLILVGNLDHSETVGPKGFKLTYSSLSNDVRGIGMEITSSFQRWGSAGKLQGVVKLNSYENIARPGWLLHELMHRWGNNIIPPYHHWGGLSSANGLLGGFDISDLVDHGGGRYTLKESYVPIPYSPIELYVAGFIPPEDVPDLWVAEDGNWIYTEDGARVRDDNGHLIFTASKVKSYTIEDIVAEHGKRIPDASQSQRDFRAAVILLVDEKHPAIAWQLDKLSGDIAAFSHPGPDENDYWFNFYEATGGRATITMDGLSQFQKSSE